jgi:hypothetical protein
MTKVIGARDKLVNKLPVTNFDAELPPPLTALSVDEIPNRRGSTIAAGFIVATLANVIFCLKSEILS